MCVHRIQFKNRARIKMKTVGPTEQQDGEAGGAMDFRANLADESPALLPE